MASDAQSIALERRVPPVLVRMRRKDRAAVRRIWEDEFGFYECNESDLTAACIDSDGKYTYGVVARDLANEEIVGFGIAFATSPDGAAEYVHDIPEVDWPDWTVVMHTGCVRSDWQGRGIGTRLFESRIGWGQRNDANGFLGIAWLPEGRYGSAALFQGHGFDRLVTVKEYYDRHGGAHCPDCGERCTCDASLYWRDER